METNKTETKAQVTSTNGVFIDAKGRLSKDGQYIIFRLADGRVLRKHINYVKAILGIAFTPVEKKVEVKQAGEPRVA